MRLVKVENLTSNMTLAKSIYQENTCLLTAGQTNLNQYINKFKKLGINYVYVNDELSQDIEINDVVKEHTRQQGKRITREVYEKIASEGEISSENTQQLKRYVSDLIDEILSSNEVLYNVVDLKNQDDYTFAHSINVTVLTLLMGKNSGLNRPQLQKLGLGTILHDLGKAVIPEEILNKPGKLTDEEFEIIREHPRLGYEKLKEVNTISPTSLAVVLGHHEKFNGRGYPRGINSNELHVFPKITAVADVYDALTSDRVYRPRWPISKALGLIYSEKEKHFDPNFVKELLKIIPFYPNGSKVKLNNGKEAIVVAQNQEEPSCPVIRIIDDHHKWTDKIDLSKQNQLVIQEELV